MSGIIWPADAVSGAPSYTGRVLREVISTLTQGATASRPFAGLDGVRPGTSTATVAATSTTWTVHAHAGFLGDPEASSLAGGYAYQFLADQTGPVTAADASNPRIDTICVQIDDPAEADSTAAPVARIYYAAGIPGTASATRGATGGPPVIPPRAFELAQIHVPKATTGSPTVSWVAPYTAAAGGIVPCASSAFYPPSPYEGMAIYDMSLNMMFVYDGSGWQRVLIGDTGWQPLTSIGGSWMTPSTVASGKAIWRIKAGGILMQGIIQPTSGNFATSSTLTLIAAGNLPPSITPTANINRYLSSSSAANGVRGVLANSGTMTIVTGTTASPYVDISGFSGYTAD